MKNFLAIFGSASFIISALFMAMHWPGYNVLFIFSLGAALPFYFFYALITELKEGNNKVLSILFFFSVFTFLVGILFSFLHWYGGDELLTVSFCLFAIFQLAKAFLGEKNERIGILMALASSFCLLGSLFILMHWPGIDIMRLIAFLSLAIIVVLNLISISKGKSKIQLESMRGFLMLVIVSGLIYLRYNAFIPPSTAFNIVYSYDELQDKNETEVNLGNILSRKNRSISTKIDIETSKLIEELDAAKIDILRNTSDVRSCIVQDRNEKNPLLPVRLDLANVNDKFDQYTPIMTMVGGDLTLINSNSIGLKIWKAYNYYRSKLVDILGTYEESGNKFVVRAGSINNFGSSEDLDKQIRTMMTSRGNNVNKEDLDVMVNIYKLMTKKEYDYYQEMDHVHWVARTFYHTTVIDAVRILTQLQNEVLTVRTLALSHLSNRM